MISVKNVWDLFSTDKSTETTVIADDNESRLKENYRERTAFSTKEFSEQERLDSPDVERRGRLRTSFLWNTDTIAYMRKYISGEDAMLMSKLEKNIWDEYIEFVLKSNIRPTEGYVGTTLTDVNGYSFLIKEDGEIDYRTCPINIEKTNKDFMSSKSLDKILVSILDEDEDFVKNSIEYVQNKISCPTSITASVDETEASGQETSGSLGYGKESIVKSYIQSFDYNNIVVSETFFRPECAVGIQGIVENCYNYEDSDRSWNVQNVTSSSGLNPEFLFNDDGIWESDGTQSEHWIQAEVTEDTLISRYRITIGLKSEMMNDWMVTAWNEKEKVWILIDRITNYVWENDNETKDFLVSNSGWYKKIRIRMIGNESGEYLKSAGQKFILMNGVIIPDKPENGSYEWFCDLKKELMSISNGQRELIDEKFNAPLKPTNLSGELL